jgi:hypothetical protein
MSGLNTDTLAHCDRIGALKKHLIDIEQMTNALDKYATTWETKCTP